MVNNKRLLLTANGTHRLPIQFQRAKAFVIGGTVGRGVDSTVLYAVLTNVVEDLSMRWNNVLSQKMLESLANHIAII